MLLLIISRIKLFKLKLLFFIGTDYEDVYASIVDYFELLHKMNIMERTIR